MKASVRKAAAMKLETEYSLLRKQQAHGSANKPRRALNMVIDRPQMDMFAFSSQREDREGPSRLKPSTPVTYDEKTALKYQFTHSTRSSNPDALS